LKLERAASMAHNTPVPRETIEAHLSGLRGRQR
jgi:hypothetical protein